MLDVVTRSLHPQPQLLVLTLQVPRPLEEVLLRETSVAGAIEAKERGEEAPPIMPRVTPHDLRHTAASLAISAGANVKAVQRMLGHASAAMTLDTYAELFEDDLDSVAVALDSQRSASLGP